MQICFWLSPAGDIPKFLPAVQFPVAGNLALLFSAPAQADKIIVSANINMDLFMDAACYVFGERFINAAAFWHHRGR